MRINPGYLQTASKAVRNSRAGITVTRIWWQWMKWKIILSHKRKLGAGNPWWPRGLSNVIKGLSCFRVSFPSCLIYVFHLQGCSMAQYDLWCSSHHVYLLSNRKDEDGKRTAHTPPGSQSPLRRFLRSLTQHPHLYTVSM